MFQVLSARVYVNLLESGRCSLARCRQIWGSKIKTQVKYHIRSGGASLYQNWQAIFIWLAECQSSDPWRFFPHHFVGELWWLRCVSVSRFRSFLYWVGCKVALVKCIVSRYLHILHVSRGMLLAICAWVRASTCFLHNLKIIDETHLIHLEIVSLPSPAISPTP